MLIDLYYRSILYLYYRLQYSYLYTAITINYSYDYIAIEPGEIYPYVTNAKKNIDDIKINHKDKRNLNL